MSRKAWYGGVVLLLVWQGFLTLQLFGNDPWQNLVNDQPIVSGTHPQNLYLGMLGVRAILTQGRISVYDHNFQIGYPSTPIFDGARLAELFLLAGGGEHAAAYKIGIACLCMMVPILLMVACRTVGLGHAATLLAVFLGQMIWWGPHGRNALETGDCVLYLASLTCLAHVGLLIAFHRTSSVWAWFGLLVTACVGWFLQPLLFPLALPVLLIYYLSVGARHDFLTWHLALGMAEVIAFLLNLPWLIDWLDSWWLRAPLPVSTDMLTHRTFVTVWQAPLWGGGTDRLLAIFLVASAAVGIIILNQTQQRAAARLLGMGAGGSLVLALLGISWEPLGDVGTAALLAPALWFACVPAAFAWVKLAQRLVGFGQAGQAAVVLIALSGVGALLFMTDSPRFLFERCARTAPLAIGLGPERQALVALLTEKTNPDARLLWEDRARPREASRWSALLPLLTGRQFVGGLDPDGFIEHSSISLMNQALEGRPLNKDNDATSWTNEELGLYCWRYNVRWIVAWSPDVIKRFERWPDAKKLAPVKDEQSGWLFEVQRPALFALQGKAELLRADGQTITLGNVEPDKNGVVVISLHHQTGMRAIPSRVQLDRAQTGFDQIGFVRLRLAVRADRVTLSWHR
jgi:hypothetical protein